jgi:hypothetical protein
MTVVPPAKNPALVDKFPDIPQGLLYMMGVSSAGYLGGKLVRSAGPVIRNIAWNEANEIIIQGENLSSEGDFFVDSVKLPIDPKKTQDLVTPTPQEQASSRTFSSQLKIKINPIAGVDLSTGDHVFRIVNKDGQFADIRLTVDPPSLARVEMKVGPPQAPAGADSTKMIAAGKEKTEVRVSGSGFRLGSIVRWTPANAPDPTELDASAITVESPTTLTLKLVPGDPGTGTLVVVAPNGFSAMATELVVAKPA